MSQRINQKPMRSLPTNHIIGVIDQFQEAEQAVQALQNAGYRAQDILLIGDRAFIEAIQQRQQQTSPFKWAIHVFFASTDVGFPADLYAQQARQGSQVLAVHTSTVDQAQQIAQILGGYHVHLLKYFGRWVTADFPS